MRYFRRRETSEELCEDNTAYTWTWTNGICSDTLFNGNEPACITTGSWTDGFCYRSPTDFTPITAGRNDGTNEDERRTSCTENQGLEWRTRCSNQKLTTETSCTVPGTFGHCELTNDIDGNVNSHFDDDYAGYTDKATCELGKPSHYWSYCVNALFGSEYGCVTPGEWGHCLFNDGDNNTALPADSVFYENDNQYCQDITTNSNLYSNTDGGGTGDKILAAGGTFSKPAYHWSQCQISYNSGTTWDWTNEFATQDECTKPGDWGNCIVRGAGILILHTMTKHMNYVRVI